ncbi:MAG: hypothetical protein Q8S84_04680 [bacterium]|nr:hypothetical protein [bacterium]
MKELMAELDNPFALSQEQGQQFAKNDSVLSDAVGGESIDSSHNLATINADISNTKAKIDAIESKGDLTTEDKREKYALNKKLNELKVLQRTELIKSKQDNREEVIKNKQETREEAIKEIDEKIATQERILKKIDTIR